MKKLLFIALIITSVLLNWCALKPASEKEQTVMCTFNDDPAMEKQIEDSYMKLARAEIYKKYQDRCKNNINIDHTNDVKDIIDQVKDIQATGYNDISTGAFQ